MELFSKLGIDWRLLIIQIINFGILLFILKRYLYKTVLEMLEKRRERVQESVDLNEKIKKEIHDFEEQKASQMEQVKNEAKNIITLASQRAQELEARAHEEAKAKSEATLEQARKVIGEEKGKIIEEARKEIAQLVVDATGKMLEKAAQGKEGEEFIKSHLKKKQ